MKTEQVLEKGLNWVAVTLFVLLAGIITAEHYVMIPPVGGFLLRVEFVGWEKEFFRIPEFSNRYWYLIVPSVVYALRCVYGLCFELDTDSKEDIRSQARIIIYVVLISSLVLCPFWHWVIPVIVEPRPQAINFVEMFSVGGVTTGVIVMLMIAKSVLFMRPLEAMVSTIVGFTTLVGVHAVALGISMYPENIVEVFIDSTLYTLGTFVLLATLFAPIIFTLTLIRTFFVRRFWRYL